MYPCRSRAINCMLFALSQHQWFNKFSVFLNCLLSIVTKSILNNPTLFQEKVAALWVLLQTATWNKGCANCLHWTTEVLLLAFTLMVSWKGVHLCVTELMSPLRFQQKLNCFPYEKKKVNKFYKYTLKF